MAALVAAPLALATSDADAARTLEEYKYFRTLSIDLIGRIPSRKELADFERPEFTFDKWMDEHLKGQDYADRLARVYADLLKLDINTFRYENRLASLNRMQVMDPNGNLIWVYFRHHQKRTPAISPGNGGFCFTPAEVGYTYTGGNLLPQANYPPTTPVTQAVLDARTTTIKPWWLYADYKKPDPTDRYDPATWATRFPGFVLNLPTNTAANPRAAANSLLKELDGVTDVTEIRICKEEANTAETAMVGTNEGLGANDPNKGKMVSCLGSYGGRATKNCGCGPGAEWCFPGTSNTFQNPGAVFVSSRNVALGADDPTDQVAFSHLDWLNLWMSQEAKQFFQHLFAEDRDFREVLTGRHTYVNGPLTQFYRHAARSLWRDNSFNYFDPPAVVDPAGLPADLTPYDVDDWRMVKDRGPNAAGILTMPTFLVKYATRRARAHALYNTFLCRSFAAPAGLQLPPSEEPNLMKREGCAACHQTLEPLSAYFTRIPESSWTWLDKSAYPAMNSACTGTNPPSACRAYYDATFKSGNAYPMRGAYASAENADLGPIGLGQSLVGRPEFARCVAQNIATNFLSREMRTEDAALIDSMVQALTGNGFRIRPMVKVLLQSNAYRSANNLAPSIWRNKGGAP
jgi:hypothetical protein